MCRLLEQQKRLLKEPRDQPDSKMNQSSALAAAANRDGISSRFSFRSLLRQQCNRWQRDGLKRCVSFLWEKPQNLSRWKPDEWSMRFNYRRVIMGTIIHWVLFVQIRRYLVTPSADRSWWAEMRTCANDMRERWTATEQGRPFCVLLTLKRIKSSFPRMLGSWCTSLFFWLARLLSRVPLRLDRKELLDGRTHGRRLGSKDNKLPLFTAK